MGGTGRDGNGGGGEWGATVRALILGALVFGLIWSYGEIWERRATGGKAQATTATAEDDGLRAGGKVTTAEWIVEGAGDSSYNGEYNEAGSYNGKPCYVGPSPADNRYLWYDGMLWILSPGLDNVTAWYGGQDVLPANPWEAYYLASPAPTVDAGGKVTMADWIVEGAGDSSYNGEYNEAGSYNGKPCYVGPSPANNRYLYWQSTKWALSWEDPSLEMDAYVGTLHADLPANPWDQGGMGGTLPAPTLSGQPSVALDAVPQGRTVAVRSGQDGMLHHAPPAKDLLQRRVCLPATRRTPFRLPPATAPVYVRTSRPCPQSERQCARWHVRRAGRRDGPGTRTDAAAAPRAPRRRAAAGAA